MLRALSGVNEKMHSDRVFSAAPFHTAKRRALPPHYAAVNVYFTSPRNKNIRRCVCFNVRCAIKRTVKITLSAALTAAVMIAIFIFSAQSGGQSSGASNGVGAWLLGILGIDVPPGQSPSSVQILFGFTVRKLAHIFLYFCLGLSSSLLSASLWGIKAELRPSRIVLSSLCAALFGLFYACTDEIHQYFVPGRAAAVTDVGIDSIGTVLSVLLCAAVQLIIYCAQRRKCRPMRQ